MMSKRTILLLIVTGVCAILAYGMMTRTPDSIRARELYEQVEEKQYQIDSLSDLVEEISRKRYADSLKYAARLNANNTAIEKYTKIIERVRFMDYSDAQLDSITFFLYPSPK